MWEFKESLLSSKIFWFTVVAFSIYLYIKKICFSYWEKHGVPHHKPIFPVGNFTSDFFKKKITFGDFWKKGYEDFKSHPFHGAYIFHKPVLVITNPELLKHILMKDFTKFSDRGLHYNETIDPISDNLFLMTGDRWKCLRAKLSPCFTSIKLKTMFPMLVEIGDDIVDTINESLLKSDIIEFKNIMTRFSIDVIFSVAFGCKSYTLRGQGSEFYYYGNLCLQNSPLRSLLLFFMPTISDFLRLPLFNPKATKFFIDLFIEMVEKRRAEKIKRQDILSFIIDLIDKELETENDLDKEIDDKVAVKLDLIKATAQAFIFFLAGYETSSSVLTYILYELALHPEMQIKLQKEIDELLEGDDGLTYESVSQLKYLDMVLNETMRMHPPIPMLNRSCVEKYQIPNSNYCVPKGMPIIVSITGLHYDPTFFPEPNKFDPTRFSKENMEKIKPCTYLPFGEGPRYCIGNRLGVSEVKVGMIKFLSNFTVSVCDKTMIPLRYTSDSVVQSPGSGLYLRVQKRRLE